MQLKCLVKEGELREVKINGEIIAFVDPFDNSDEEAYSHLETLHKLNGYISRNTLIGNQEIINSAKREIDKLYEQYPVLERLEEEYEEKCRIFEMEIEKLNRN